MLPSSYSPCIAHSRAWVQLTAPWRRPQLSNVPNQDPSPAVSAVSSRLAPGKVQGDTPPPPTVAGPYRSPSDSIHHLYPVKNSKGFFSSHSNMILYFVNVGPDSMYYNLQLSFFIIISYLIACPSLADTFTFVSY